MVTALKLAITDIFQGAMSRDMCMPYFSLKNLFQCSSKVFSGACFSATRNCRPLQPLLHPFLNEAEILFWIPGQMKDKGAVSNKRNVVPAFVLSMERLDFLKAFYRREYMAVWHINWLCSCPLWSGDTIGRRPNVVQTRNWRRSRKN